MNIHGAAGVSVCYFGAILLPSLPSYNQGGWTLRTVSQGLMDSGWVSQREEPAEGSGSWEERDTGVVAYVSFPIGLLVSWGNIAIAPSGCDFPTLLSLAGLQNISFQLGFSPLTSHLGRARCISSFLLVSLASVSFLHSLLMCTLSAKFGALCALQWVQWSTPWFIPSPKF